MKKMRFRGSPDWAYGSKTNAVHFWVTNAQLNRAMKKVPTYALRERQDALKSCLREDRNWLYIRRKDGSTWVVSSYLWFKGAWEIPLTVAQRLEALNDLVESW